MNEKQQTVLLSEDDDYIPSDILAVEILKWMNTATISTVHANTVHRTRHSTYHPQRSIIPVKLVNFVQKPKTVIVVWNRMELQSLEMMETINGSTFHKINIGADMFHWVKVA